MKKPAIKWRAAAMCVAFSLAAHSSPMGFKDSWMTMGDFSPNWREAYTNYALTTQDAFGAAAIYMRSDDHQQSLDLVEADYTRLVERWNLADAQANVWFVGGLGNERTYRWDSPWSSTKAMVSPGMQFDYETTRVYLAATARLFRAEGINHDFASARAGFSFYETEFDQTQPWLIIEARRMHDLSDKTEITPMLRLVNKDFFIEAGVNNARQMRFNFMYIL